MAEKKKIRYYVVIVGGKPLSQLISDRTKKERSEIARYRNLAGIEIKEAEQADFEHEQKSREKQCYR